MENVRFATNERVDVPDAQALGFLATYEFRRMIRGLMLGAGESRIINGFRAVASSPADAFVTVQLDPGGGGWLSHALGAQLVDARTDYGVLIGGDNSFSELGGNASYPVDFTGQPNGDYIIEMRFTLIAGKTDNRRFVNPTTHVESTQPTDTRYIPALEVRRIGGTVPTGGQWLPIAQVAWAGSTIASGAITDRRTFAAEGSALVGFQRNGWGATGGIPDFDRSTDRAQVGLNALYPLARAIMRQVQDIKGRTGGLLDWFARGPQPMRVGFSGLPSTDQTKGLAENSETCVFTVGDGVTEWGDFSGVNGLQDCLSHIASQKASLPNSIRVVLKTRANAFASIFTLATPVDLSDVSVTIDGASGCYEANRVIVDFTHSGSATPFFSATSGSSFTRLTLIGLESVVPSAIKTVNPIAHVRRLTMRNCKFAVSPAASFALQCTSAGSLLEESEIDGDINFYGGSTTGSVQGLVRALIGRSTASSNNGKETAISLAVSGSIGHGLRIIDSRFRRLDGLGASRVVIEDCFVSPGIDHDAIRCGGTSASRYWRIRNLTLSQTSDPTGGHSAGAGTNGAAGTGWGVYCVGAGGDTIRNRQITIEGIYVVEPSGIDAGIVRVDDGTDIRISGINTTSSLALNAGALACSGVVFDNVRDGWIERNTFEGMSGASGSFTFESVRLTGSNAQRIHVENNALAVATAWSIGSSNVRCDAVVVRDVWIERNRCLGDHEIHVWLNAASTDARGFFVRGNIFDPVTAACVVFDASIGTVRHVRVCENNIEGTSTSLGAQLFSAGSGTNVNDIKIDNNVLVGPTSAGPARGLLVAFISGAATNLSVCHNLTSGRQRTGGASAPETLLGLFGGGSGITIIGNQHTGGSTGDQAIRMQGMTGASVIVFFGNSLDGNVITNNAGVGIWNPANSNYVTGTVTP